MMPMRSLSGVLIRQMRLSDIPAGLALCRASGWNQTVRDWLHFLTAAPHGALAAEQDGTVIGTVATLPYGPFTWISMVLVDPAARGRGVGTLLLERGLELIPEGTAARLDATPAGEIIYRKLGFVPEYGLARWFRDAADRAPSVENGAPNAERRAPIVRPFAADDWSPVLEMDARAFGAARGALLERLAADAPEHAWVSEIDGRLQGYLFGRHGHVREHLGPLVADRVETARLLLRSCLAAHPERPWFLDAPDDQHAWRDSLSELGFRIQRPFLRMYRGSLTSPGQPASIYAITGPEFG